MLFSCQSVAACFVIVCASGLGRLLATEPHVAVLAGAEFPDPRTLQHLDTGVFEDLLTLAGAEGAFGAFYAKFGEPNCRQAPYFECKTANSSAEGGVLLHSARDKLLQATRMEDGDERAWWLLASVEVALKNPHGALSAIEEYIADRDNADPNVAMDLLLQVHLMASRNCFWNEMSTISSMVKIVRESSDTAFPPLHFVELQGVSAADVHPRFSTPFIVLASPAALLTNPQQVRRNCQTASAHIQSRVVGDSSTVRQGNVKLGKKKKVKLAYINAVGFNEVYLFLALVFARNQAQFHVTCYAAQPAHGPSGARDHMEQHCDAFVDISGLSPAAMAARIAADKIHVLVDLNGLTQGSTAPFLQAIAESPAPIQLHFHGQPFTTGAPFIHGYVGDPVSTPVEYREFYSERLVLLPEYYLMHSLPAVKKNVRTSAAEEFSRDQLGFSEGDLLLASFLQPYKIEPRVFAVWTRILHRVPKAKLWLFRYRLQGIGGGRELEANIHAALEAAGLSKQRVVLSDLFPEQNQHQIKRVADLFLDTFTFNAHTTAYDALFAGLPVLSLANETQPSRVASSLLKAADLEVCIARTEKDYEELAVQLLRSLPPKKRASKKKTKAAPRVVATALKKRFAVATSAPLPVSLFDLRAFTVAFEAAVRMSVEVGMRMHIVVSSVLRQHVLRQEGVDTADSRGEKGPWK